jgi:hypothetical protein
MTYRGTYDKSRPFLKVPARFLVSTGAIAVKGTPGWERESPGAPVAFSGRVR